MTACVMMSLQDNLACDECLLQQHTMETVCSNNEALC